METSRWDKLCVQEGPPCVLNVFQAELMSPTRSERCARCMCHVCTYKPAPLAVLLATVVTHSEPVLPGGMYLYVQCSTCIDSQSEQYSMELILLT